MFLCNQSYYNFWVKLWCAFVLESISFSLVCLCVFVSRKKKEWVIVSHCLRECVVCSITCPTSFKSYHGFWVELWCVFVLEHIFLSFVCVCVFVSPKKSLNNFFATHYMAVKNTIHVYL